MQHQLALLRDDGAPDGVTRVSIAMIRPSPENDRLYRPIDETDPAIRELARSIGKHGVREPIVVSTDLYILSGHRRYAAARLAGLDTVPCRVEPISRREEPDRFVVLLREFNRQRVKSLDEQVREALVDANPHEARAELVLHRALAAEVGLDPLEIGDARARKSISSAKAPFVKAIKRVLEERREFWPLSDRQIHYALLNDPPLKHASKPGSVYDNTASSYKSLVELLTRLRLFGEIPFQAIGDETRPVDVWRTHREPGAFLRDEIDGFLKGYFRDLLQSQPHHVEILVEKNTVAPIVRPVAMHFAMPMTSGRGYCSLPPRWEMAQRFRRSGKKKLVVLIVTDFDPDGEAIAESFARSMRDDFGIDQIHPVKVALTAEQVELHDLPPSMEAKATSSRTKGFVERHGSAVWELEALPPETLQEIVRDAIEESLDLEALQREIDAEANDAAQLQAVRETVRDALAQLDLGSGS